MTEKLSHALLQMQAEFESGRLEIALVPSRRDPASGGCIRVAVNKNAQWYSGFCSQHASSRIRKKAAFDTRIKRRNVERLLGRLVAGLPSQSKYASEILKIAERITQPTRRIA